MKGKFIVIEGIDGCGTTTQIEELSKWLPNSGLIKKGSKLITTREPGGSLLGKKLRGLILDNNENNKPSSLAELLLYSADRAEHVSKIISPALATSLTKIILSKSIQSVTAGWLIRIVGLSLVEYFKNGQDWGDGGIQEVVDKIYRMSKREDILNNFIKEAISKIEMKKYFKSNKSLPPFTN